MSEGIHTSRWGGVSRIGHCHHTQDTGAIQVFGKKWETSRAGLRGCGCRKAQLQEDRSIRDWPSECPANKSETPRSAGLHSAASLASPSSPL